MFCIFNVERDCFGLVRYEVIVCVIVDWNFWFDIDIVGLLLWFDNDDFKGEEWFFLECKLFLVLLFVIEIFGIIGLLGFFVVFFGLILKWKEDLGDICFVYMVIIFVRKVIDGEL